MAIFRRVPEDEGAPPAAGGRSPGSTWIGEHTALEGKIATNDDLCIQGRLTGVVEGESAVLVPAGGRVEANIQARSVTIHGHVVGDIEASEQTEIAASGSLVGGISAPSVVVRPGATFEGTVHQRRSEPPPDPAS